MAIEPWRKEVADAIKDFDNEETNIDDYRRLWESMAEQADTLVTQCLQYQNQLMQTTFALEQANKLIAIYEKREHEHKSSETTLKILINRLLRVVGK